MTPHDPTRRSFVKASVALAGATALCPPAARAAAVAAPLLAYVGTFSSPLRDTLPTQVDLPPGNGRGIHTFTVDRVTGALTAARVCETGTSPSCLAVNAAGTRLYSANETDRVGKGKQGSVSAFAVDRADGKLRLLNTVRSGGAGPRHFHFHPNGKWLYSVQEEASTVVLFDYGGEAGTLTARQTLSTLPAGFAGSNFCSEILVSADGKFVCVGNRLHDSIGVFAVGPTGTLTHVGDEWTRGNYPRSFGFDPTGRFLYCCNQRADNVTVFRVDAGTGRLGFTGHYTPVGNPSHVVFVDLAGTD
jgi:6-phosphogluconolactonase (cycloisomerase 2 family)